MKASETIPGDAVANAGDPPALEVPPGVDRRTFMMRSSVIGSAVVITGRTLSAEEQTKAAPPKVNLSPELNVVKKSKGPVMTSEGGLAVSLVLC